MSEHFPKIDSGRYEIVSELGKGGMGIVYRAVHKQLSRPVALKIIKLGLLADEAQVKMFRREIEALAAVQHPNIISIHDVGEYEGQPFYTMDFIDGCTLEELLNRFGSDRKQGASSSLKDAIAQVAQTRILEAGKEAQKVMVGKFRAIPVNQSLHLMVKILGALEYIHNRGIIHRDIKPSNIMLTRDGEPLLMDFGLAKSLQPKSGATVTQTGQIMGTPAYMSPEQAEGRREGVSEKSDLYSMGAVFYEMLSGRPPVIPTGHALADIHAVIDKNPLPLRRVNALIAKDLENICHKALEKEPERRYRTAQGFSDDLERYRQGEPVLARPPGILYRLRKKIAKNKWSYSAAALLVVTAGAFLGYGLRSTRSIREKERALLEEKRKSEGRWLLAYENNFDGASLDWQNWLVYLPQLNNLKTEVREGVLILEKKGRLFSKVNIPGNVKMEFDAAVEGDQEVSGYFNCGDSLMDNDEFYYFCWYHDDLKIQKGRRGPVVDGRFFAETTVSDLRSLTGRRAHLTVVNENGRCQLFIDGKLSLESRDLFYLDKVNNGIWGFRSIGGKTTIDNLRVFHQLPPEKVGIDQIAGVHIAENRFDKAVSLLTKIVMNYNNPVLLGEAVNLFSAIEAKTPGDSVIRQVIANRSMVDRIMDRAELPAARLFMETAAARMPRGIRMPDFININDRLAGRLPPEGKFSVYAYWGMVFRYWNMDSVATLFLEKARAAGGHHVDQKYLDRRSLSAPSPGAGEMKLVEGGLLALSADRVLPVNPFYLDSTEVTQAAFRRVMGYDPSYFNSRNLPDTITPEEDGRMPTDHITWYEAVLFCNARSRAEGLDTCYQLTDPRDTLLDNPHDHSMAGARYHVKIFKPSWNQYANGYRLPTALEFEYAVSDDVPRPFFDEYFRSRMDAWSWHLTNSDGHPHPVATKAPNRWGLYDLVGNAWEWCWDESLPDDRNPGLLQTHPTESLIGGGRDELLDVLGNHAISLEPWSRNFDHSFRCARTVFPKKELP